MRTTTTTRVVRTYGGAGSLAYNCADLRKKMEEGLYTHAYITTLEEGGWGGRGGPFAASAGVAVYACACGASCGASSLRKAPRGRRLNCQQPTNRHQIIMSTSCDIIS